MRNWVFFFFLATGGAAAGTVLGHALATVEAVSNGPFLNPHYSDKPGFDGVVENFAKLGGYESVAANCNGTSSVDLALSTEAEIVHDLEQQKLSSPDLLGVAEAKVLVRKVIVAEKTRIPLDADTAPRAEELLKRAGWTDPSVGHMREIIQGLDRDQCKQISLPKGGSQ